MAIDYGIFLEEDIEISAVLARISEDLPLHVSKQTMRELDAEDREGFLWLWMRRRTTEDEIPYPEFINYLPRTEILVSLDKERRNEGGKERLAQVVAALFKITAKRVTILMNGDILLLKRAPGQPPTFFTPDFWTDRMKAIIDPSGHLTLTEIKQVVTLWGSMVLRFIGYRGLGASPAVLFRVVIGISIIGAEGIYIFTHNPGLAALRLTNGKVLGGTLPPSSWWKSSQSQTDFIRLLDEQDPGTVMEVVITGHADDQGITTGYEYSYIQDLVGPLKRALAPQALVSINGCHSADAAKSLSAAIPDITVTGYSHYILGGNPVGINGVIFPWGFTIYQNGQELP